MIPSAPTRFVMVLAAAMGGTATVTAGGAARAGGTTPMVDPTAHSQTTDRFVNGRYDKTGTYIPPHYQAASKPRLHGYFFNKNEGGSKAGKAD